MTEEDSSYKRENVSFRKINFSHTDCGSYVTLYQNPGREPLLDLNFFEGDRTIQQSRILSQMLSRALARAEKWKKEGKKPKRR